MSIKFNELTIENVGAWPMAIKLILLTIVFCMIVFLGYWLDSRTQLQYLSSARLQQDVLLHTVKTKQEQTSNLKAYRKQLQHINEVFEKLLQQLPTRSQVPGLLDDISKTGLTNGLDFKLFKPLAEKKVGFYAELPIEIVVVGNYHQLAQFISEVAGLNRIVTLHDFTIRPLERGDIKSGTPQEELEGKLLLSVTAKTYRYLADAEREILPKEQT